MKNRGSWRCKVYNFPPTSIQNFANKLPVFSVADPVRSNPWLFLATDTDLNRPSGRLSWPPFLSLFIGITPPPSTLPVSILSEVKKTILVNGFGRSDSNSQGVSNKAYSEHYSPPCRGAKDRMAFSWRFSLLFSAWPPTPPRNYEAVRFLFPNFYTQAKCQFWLALIPLAEPNLYFSQLARD